MTTNRVESGKVRYDVIELDNLHLQKMGKTLKIFMKILLDKQ